MATGSGWKFHSIASLDIHTVKYKPLRGGSWVLFPKFIAGKKALVNMKNKDNQCFKYCVAKHLNPTKAHPERITKDLREHAKSLNFSGIVFPVNLKVIGKFEKNKPEIAMNVLVTKARPEGGKAVRQANRQKTNHLSVENFRVDGKRTQS